MWSGRGHVLKWAEGGLAGGHRAWDLSMVRSLLCFCLTSPGPGPEEMGLERRFRDWQPAPPTGAIKDRVEPQLPPH